MANAKPLTICCDQHAMEPVRMMKKIDIAEAYWQPADQPKSTWTHEPDLRPMSETS